MTTTLVQIPSGPGRRVRRPSRSYATPAVVAAIEVAGETIAPSEVVIGDASTILGGPFPPHRSHQTGLDVDISSPIADVAAADPALVAFTVAANEVTPLEYVFSSQRVEQLRAEGLPARSWPGHTSHVHLRFRAEGAPVPTITTPPPPPPAKILKGLATVVGAAVVLVAIVAAFLATRGRSSAGRSSAVDSEDLGRYSDSELRSLYRAAIGKGPRPGAGREDLEGALYKLDAKKLAKAVDAWEAKRRA